MKINWTKNAKFWCPFYYVLFYFHFLQKIRKNNIAGWGKKSKNLKWPQKFLSYVLQLYLTGDQKKLHFWNLDINAKLKEKNETSNISLNISKKLARIFDHQLDLIKAHNKGTLETILGFWIFGLLFFNSKRPWCHSKSHVMKPLFFDSAFLLWQIMILIYQKHLNKAEQIIKQDCFSLQNAENFGLSALRLISDTYFCNCWRTWSSFKCRLYNALFSHSHKK